MATEASNRAAEILTQLGQDFVVPTVDLSGAEFALPDQLANPRYDAVGSKNMEDLTTGIVGGGGAFDKLMSSTKAHLEEQFEKGLISGDQYTKAYIELTTASMSTALQFLLQNEQGYWQALVAQSQARKAEVDAVTSAVQLEIAKQQLAGAVYQAKMLQAQHVLAQMQIANEDVKYNLGVAQIEMVGEQTEAQRAQTQDTRSDGVTPVDGIIGKQKALYTQQITSYQRDAESKIGKMYLDGWITQKTLDEGLIAPDELTNAGVEAVLGMIRANAGLT